MNPVDVLSFAVTAAQYIRSAADPEAVLADGFRMAGVPAPDPAEPFAVRVARLVAAVADDRRDLLDHLRAKAGPLPLNRPMPSGDGELDEADPEAVRLLEYVEDNEGDAVPMFGDCPFTGFNIADRSASGFFEDSRPGAAPLPATARCLLDYPLEVPVLFTIETGANFWNLWDVCVAIANQYARVYEQADRYGVWGHDLTDLVIENLLYYPTEGLIYPHIGS
jgi:hypothetical protein